MPLLINSMASDRANRSMNKIRKNMAATLEKLATGHRINKAGDDAAGLAISENLRAEIRSLNQAQRNAYDGASLVQTADGALGQSSDMLARMRELAMEAGNGALSDDQRAAIQTEYDQLQAELDRQAGTAEYNGQHLLDGSLGAATGGLEFQVGTGTGDEDRIAVTIEAMDSASLGVDGTSVSTQQDASDALDAIDQAIDQVSAQRSDLGAASNRFDSTITRLSVAAENAAAANARMRDTDVAMEVAKLAGEKIMQQAAAAVMAQANAQPAVVLNLLGD